MKRLLVLVATILGLASAYLKSYEVTPTLASWSGWAPGGTQYGVGQTFTANFDSICWCDVFIGYLGANPSDPFNVDIYEYPDGVNAVAYAHQVTAQKEHHWLNFPLTAVTGQKFIRGQQYLLKVTRPGDSINWYKRGDNPYPYGKMLSNMSPPPPDDDICARIYGKARVGDEFAVQSNVAWRQDYYQPWYDTMPYTGPDTWDACIRRESEVGVKYDKIGYGFWPNVQRTGNTRWVWGWLDTLMTKFAQHGVGTIMSIRGVPAWASCSEWNDGGVWRKNVGSLPSNIFEPVTDTANHDTMKINPSNYLAKYAYELVRRYGPKGRAADYSRCGTFWDSAGNLPYQPIVMYESYPELPLCAMRQDTYRDGAFWRRDTTDRARLSDLYYRGLIPGYTLQDRKSSFLRVAARVIIVVDSAIKMACKYPDSEPVRPRTMAYVWGDGHVGVYSMPDWLNGLKSYHADEFFDIATYFGYEGMRDPEAHAATFLARRDTMIAAGYAPRSFVLTEFSNASGYPAPWTQHDRAYHLQKAYAAIQAANTIPGCPLEVGAWFTFTKQYMSFDASKDSSSPIIEDSAHDWESWEPAYAYEQWSELCQGASFEGRVSPWDGPQDSVYVLQYRDSSSRRFWVAWRPVGWTGGSTCLTVPARADTESVCGIATSPFQSSSSETTTTTGWFAKQFDTFPVIIREGENFARPDVVVDSVRMTPSLLYIGHPATAHVYFHNADSVPVPEGPATGQHYTWFVLRHDGDSVAETLCNSQLSPPNNSGSVSITVASVPSSWHGTGLFDATANYGQRYVELNGMDDNDGYSRNNVYWYPGVDLVDVLSGHHGNEPLVLLGLHTYSHERDTTGQTPCDSARVVRWWYGLNDTVVHAADTTAWFCLNQSSTAFDTSVRFLSGQGKYKLLVEAKDSWTSSGLVSDSTHPYVYFDTTGPTGSVVINHAARFTTTSTCTLKLAAQDSGSGVAKMHFANIPKVSLVQNGSFTSTGGGWSYSGAGSGFDTTLGMAKLATGGATSVRQFIPKDTILAYAGDSCVMQASIMALMHGGNTLGEVSYWLYKIRQDTSLHDTSYILVDSANFQDSLAFWGQCPYGGSPLTKRFLLGAPAAESGWVWRGGMVKVQAVGINGAAGTVYADNISINGFKPDTGYAWWGQYETLAQWSVGSGAGMKVVRAAFLDSAGNENSTTICDTIVLDPTAPVVHVTQPSLGLMVNGTVEVTGWAFDTVEVTGDSWFSARRLYYRSADSTNWRPLLPDSCSHVPAYPNWQFMNPAVHLGYWNTAPIPNGQFYLKLTASDSAGHLSSCSTWVMVQHGRGGRMSRQGPSGGGTGVGQGSLYAGSSTGCVLHLSDNLDSLDCCQVTDSGSQAYVTSVLEVGNDSLLVLDARNKRIHKLHRNGQGRRRLVSNLSLPMQIVKDDDANLWLVDKGISRIGKFRSDGTPVFVRGGLGSDSLHFHSPEAIAVKGSLVYVADTKNDRIAVWDTSGNYEATITGDFANPTSVMVTDSGAIYLTDGNDGNLKGITPLGGNIATIVSPDSDKLRGLVASDNGHWLFTLAPQPNKVYKLQIQSDESMPGGVQSSGMVNLPKTLSLGQPFPNPARTRLTIAYALPRATRVSVRLYDVAGKLVNSLASGEKKPGYYNLVWNRQDTKGRTCACGIYFCTLSAENQRFSRKVILTE